jgi:hypothetical protein
MLFSPWSCLSFAEKRQENAASCSSKEQLELCTCQFGFRPQHLRIHGDSVPTTAHIYKVSFTQIYSAAGASSVELLQHTFKISQAQQLRMHKGSFARSFSKLPDTQLPALHCASHAHATEL